MIQAQEKAETKSPTERGKEALARIETAGGDLRAAWLEYGAALNALRDSLPVSSDHRTFGNAVQKAGLDLFHDGTDAKVHRDARSAAQWAAANPEQLERAEASENAPGVASRGGFRALYAIWKNLAEEDKAKERAAARRTRAPLWSKERAYQDAVAELSASEANLGEAEAELLGRLRTAGPEGVTSSELEATSKSAELLLEMGLALRVTDEVYVAVVYPIPEQPDG